MSAIYSTVDVDYTSTSNPNSRVLPPHPNNNQHLQQYSPDQPRLADFDDYWTQQGQEHNLQHQQHLQHLLPGYNVATTQLPLPSSSNHYQRAVDATNVNNTNLNKDKNNTSHVQHQSTASTILATLPVVNMGFRPTTTQPSKCSKLKIHIYFDSTIFQAGGNLFGRMEIIATSSKSLKLGEIAVELAAYEEITSKEYTATQSFLSSRLCFQGPNMPPSNAVHGAVDGAGYWMARKGKTTFPFAFQLPLDCPSSLVFGTTASLRYVVTGAVQVFYHNKDETVLKSKEAFVVEAWDGYNPEYRLPVQANNLTRLFWGGSGALELSAMLSEQLHSAGGNLIVEVRVKNNTSRKVQGIKLGIARKLIMVSDKAQVEQNPGSHIDTTSISEIVGTQEYKSSNYLFDTGEERTMTIDMIVPGNTRTIRGTALFEVTCFVVVSMMLGTFSGELSVEIPIKICHPASLTPAPKPKVDNNHHPYHYNIVDEDMDLGADLPTASSHSLITSGHDPNEGSGRDLPWGGSGEDGNEKDNTEASQGGQGEWDQDYKQLSPANSITSIKSLQERLSRIADKIQRSTSPTRNQANSNMATSPSKNRDRPMIAKSPPLGAAMPIAYVPAVERVRYTPFQPPPTTKAKEFLQAAAQYHQEMQLGGFMMGDDNTEFDLNDKTMATAIHRWISNKEDNDPRRSPRAVSPSNNRTSRSTSPVNRGRSTAPIAIVSPRQHQQRLQRQAEEHEEENDDEKNQTQQATMVSPFPNTSRFIHHAHRQPAGPQTEAYGSPAEDFSTTPPMHPRPLPKPLASPSNSHSPTRPGRSLSPPPVPIVQSAESLAMAREAFERVKRAASPPLPEPNLQQANRPGQQISQNGPVPLPRPPLSKPTSNNENNGINPHLKIQIPFNASVLQEAAPVSGSPRSHRAPHSPIVVEGPSSPVRPTPTAQASSGVGAQYSPVQAPTPQQRQQPPQAGTSTIENLGPGSNIQTEGLYRPLPQPVPKPKPQFLNSQFSTGQASGEPSGKGGSGLLNLTSSQVEVPNHLVQQTGSGMMRSAQHAGSGIVDPSQRSRSGSTPKTPLPMSSITSNSGGNFSYPAPPGLGGGEGQFERRQPNIASSPPGSRMMARPGVGANPVPNGREQDQRLTAARSANPASAGVAAALAQKAKAPKPTTTSASHLAPPRTTQQHQQQPMASGTAVGGTSSGFIYPKAARKPVSGIRPTVASKPLNLSSTAGGATGGQASRSNPVVQQQQQQQQHQYRSTDRQPPLQELQQARISAAEAKILAEEINRSDTSRSARAPQTIIMHSPPPPIADNANQNHPPKVIRGFDPIPPIASPPRSRRLEEQEQAHLQQQLQQQRQLQQQLAAPVLSVVSEIQVPGRPSNHISNVSSAQEPISFARQLHNDQAIANVHGQEVEKEDEYEAADDHHVRAQPIAAANSFRAIGANSSIMGGYAVNTGVLRKVMNSRGPSPSSEFRNPPQQQTPPQSVSAFLMSYTSSPLNPSPLSTSAPTNSAVKGIEPIKRSSREEKVVHDLTMKDIDFQTVRPSVISSRTALQQQQQALIVEEVSIHDLVQDDGFVENDGPNLDKTLPKIHERVSLLNLQKKQQQQQRQQQQQQQRQQQLPHNINSGYRPNPAMMQQQHQQQQQQHYQYQPQFNQRLQHQHQQQQHRALPTPQYQNTNNNSNAPGVKPAINPRLQEYIQKYNLATNSS